MSKVKMISVVVLTAFALGGSEILPGPAEVPVDAVERLQKKGLIAEVDADDLKEALESDSEGDGSLEDVTLERDALRAKLQNQENQFNASRSGLKQEPDELEAKVTDLQSKLDAAIAANTPPSPLAMLESIGVDIPATLIKAGFDTPEKVNEATDAKLEELPGIGKATIAKIRDALKAE